MVQFYLECERVAEFVKYLMDQKPVFAPHRKGQKSFAFAKTENPEEVVLAYNRTMHSVKKFFLPPREELLSFNLKDNSFTAPTAEASNAIFLGVHSYDLAAVKRLDHNFTEGNPEKNYLTRRQGAIFIGVSFEPDEYHFSGSVGLYPHDSAGCDIFLTKLMDGYILEVLTTEGEGLMKGFDLPGHESGKPVAGHFKQHIYVPQEKLSQVMAQSYNHEVWEETSEKCVGCGTCNLVCPTCYCFNVEESVDVKVESGSRDRTWDGCMLREFSEVAGGEFFREDVAARQRHRVFRKFKYISDTTGEPWCVGCGRCTAYCTAGISIVNIVNRLVNDYERVIVSPV
jgi:formate hydrogenlyase subunit 6/NADH:ubiquinone oxidoreductase subunit I